MAGQLNLRSMRVRGHLVKAPSSFFASSVTLQVGVEEVLSGESKVKKVYVPLRRDEKLWCPDQVEFRG